MKSLPHILFLIIPVCITLSGKSQDTTHFNRNKVTANRELIRQQIISNEIDSIQIFKIGYSNDFSIVSIEEEELLILIKGKYNKLLQKISINEQFSHKKSDLRFFKYNNDSLKRQYKYAHPYIFDSLHFEINSYITSNYKEIQKNITLSDLSKEKKDFLTLYLLYYVLYPNFCEIEIEQEMVKSSKNFNEDYPNSPYKYFILKYINIEYKTGKLGTGGYLQTGLIIPSGNLGNQFSPLTSIVAGLTLNYDKVYLFSGFGGTLGGKLKQDLYAQKTWHKDVKVHGMQGELLLGYTIIDKKRIGITPFIGISGTTLYPYSKQDSTYYSDIDGLIPSNTLTFGINFDLKWKQKNPSCYRGSNSEILYGLTRLSIGYNNPQYNSAVTDLTGSLWYIKIGIGYQNQFRKKIKKK